MQTPWLPFSHGAEPAHMFPTPPAPAVPPHAHWSHHSRLAVPMPTQTRGRYLPIVYPLAWHRRPPQGSCLLATDSTRCHLLPPYRTPAPHPAPLLPAPPPPTTPLAGHPAQGPLGHPSPSAGQQDRTAAPGTAGLPGEPGPWRCEAALRWVRLRPAPRRDRGMTIEGDPCTGRHGSIPPFAHLLFPFRQQEREGRRTW